MAWDNLKILKLAGEGSQEIINLLATHGITPPDRSVVSMWRHRRRIGPAWIAPLIYALLAQGIVNDPRDLMRRVRF